VEGPADLDLVSIDRVFCRVGKLRTRVPKGAEGLVISSPSSAVLDLGTEFGLNVEAGGRARVKVFEGRAEAVMHRGSGNENLTQLVGVNRAFELDPKSSRIKADPVSEGFISPLDLPTPSLVLDADYPGAVLASRPWSYWRFESLEAGAIPNEVPGRPPLFVHGPVRLTAAAENNHAAVFKAGENLQFLEMDGSWEPTPDAGYAVELWFLAESIGHCALFSMPAPAGTNHHLFFLETESRNRHAMHPPAMVRLLDRWPPAVGGGHNIYSRSLYIPYRWHHLVGQMSGGRMELFLDGEPTYSLSTDLAHPTVPCQVILGRLSSVPVNDSEDERWLFSRAFAGRLDEVAIYNHPLSIEEIRGHHRLAAQRVREVRANALE
jgi:hypothetical protein